MSGKLYVVGIGPGGAEHMTPAARAAIGAATTVVGYQTYLELLPELLEGKKLVSSGMMKEVERCRRALEIAGSGETVALVSSGDAGIYGMAGLVLELAENWPGKKPEIEIVPGVSAVQAAAALLGAPLMHDFAVISLSDLLTPWETIRRRLEAAAGADFVVALYNPRSRGRVTQIVEAREILLRHRSPQTPVGLVRNACRAGETVTVSDLSSFLEHDIDMFTVVIIGNGATRVDGAGRMVTPRGYQEKGKRKKEEAGEPEPSPVTEPLSSASPARALFIGGTGSDVGKSVIAAGLCRLLRRRGISVAPFKAQNMALNSAVTPEGGEIGRAQALQAAACGLPPHTDMNPVLLKPNSDTGSQVVIQGRPVGNMTVAAYHAYKPEAFERVRESYGRLAAAHEVVVMEGAGSIAEINLMAHDITNLRAAQMAGAPVLLVADIDRGGVFASLVGTFALLAPAEAAQVKGIIINRFRGEPSLLASGIAEVERRCGVPVLGVVPWLKLQLPEEDSVALGRKVAATKKSALRIGVVRLPRLSNYSDFDPLEQDPGVELVYLDRAQELVGLDLLILPGTKNTLDDLSFLHQSGLFAAILEFHAGGGEVAGICGGYQILGRAIRDPLGVESDRVAGEGLGLLDVETVLGAVKQTHQAEGLLLAAAAAVGFSGPERICGYEIHMGETVLGADARPLMRLISRSGKAVDLEDGAVSADGRVWGSYLHGLFDDPMTRRGFLDGLRSRRGLPPGCAPSGPTLESELDRLADHLAMHLDLGRILALLDLPGGKKE
ncbi:adenosylcobyric acid synthase (glutamine-hydrolysing) [Desulfuromonas soudanensis]|uniref:Cobyric acid synthase n=1 Tax=Desulfuromonas soudanensis TaxID=1603606 RepID=A0A0M5IYH4_9BACT|nr:cobyric acid synthase [Desulfuromonas soudanensis]ALC15418.1 adenosylcobyric acid synthase (glutamine-hydrolysing) [Desulfuromonas soudanensis]